MFMEIRLYNLMTYVVNDMSKSLKYTGWSLMYQIQIGLE